eukprot:2455331-Rhodomonas_salina.1
MPLDAAASACCCSKSARRCAIGSCGGQGVRQAGEEEVSWKRGRSEKRRLVGRGGGARAREG